MCRRPTATQSGTPRTCKLGKLVKDGGYEEDDHAQVAPDGKIVVGKRAVRHQQQLGHKVEDRGECGESELHHGSRVVRPHDVHTHQQDAPAHLSQLPQVRLGLVLAMEETGGTAEHWQTETGMPARGDE